MTRYQEFEIFHAMDTNTPPLTEPGGTHVYWEAYNANYGFSIPCASEKEAYEEAQRRWIESDFVYQVRKVTSEVVHTYPEE
jgi:hypothetical protein